MFLEGLKKFCWMLLLELFKVGSSTGRNCSGAYDGNETGNRGDNVTGTRGYVGSCSGTLLESLLDSVLDQLWDTSSNDPVHIISLILLISLRE